MTPKERIQLARDFVAGTLPPEIEFTLSCGCVVHIIFNVKGKTHKQPLEFSAEIVKHCHG